MSNQINYLDTTITMTNLNMRGNILPDSSVNARNIGSSSSYFNSINVSNIITNTTGRISIGDLTGINNQGTSSIAIGYASGSTAQGSSSVAIGNQAGQTTQGASSVAIGIQAGQTTQGSSSVAIGNQAGQTTQGASSVAIGIQAGQTTQGASSVAIGIQAGQTTQGSSSVAIGNQAGQITQGSSSIAIGIQAGQTTQGSSSIAIGIQAAQYSQGASSIAIGNYAGQTNQPSQSIILNANNSGFSTATQSNSLYINPIRRDNTNATQNPIYYNPNTKELTYIDQPTLQLTISQNVTGETLKKDIVQYNFKRMAIKNSSIDYSIDNYIDNAQEYTFGRSSQNLWVAVGSGTHTLAYSTNGKNWIGLGSTIFSTRGNGVSWNGNMWVAVGSGTNSIAYSYNGLSWFPAYNSLNIFNFEGLCITWNGNLWIAGGSGTSNTMAYSYDGINWIGLGFIFKDFCRRIEFNGTTLCAVGGGISRATFTGGFQTLGTIKATQTFRTMCCSASGQYQYAINPTGGSEPNYTSTQLYRSTDFGNTWATTGSATGGSSYINWICCSRSGQYVYFGLSTASVATVVVSTDFGATLTTKTISSANSSSGMWVCCSGDGSIVYAIGEAFYSKSTDYGNTWSTGSSTILLSGVSTSLQNNLRGICCSLDGKYVIILRSSASIGAVFVSWDYGVNWFNAQNSTFINLRNRACCMSTSGQYMFVTPIYETGSYISRDYGVSWVKTTSTVTGVSACCSDDFRFILSCDNFTQKKIFYSSNFGNSFTDITDSPLTVSVGYDSVCCSSDFSYTQYVVNGSVYNRQLSSLIVTSISSGIIYPGLVLSGTGISSNTRISSFVSGSGLNGSLGNYRLNTFPYFASTTISATSSSIAYSTDGLNWTNNMSSVLANQGNGVGWNGNTWLISGIGSSVFSASVTGSIQPRLSISSVSYGLVYPGLNITGGTIASNTFISTGNVTFVGSISGTTLIVTSTSGIISVGMSISGSGIITGTLITSGSGLSWTVSISQTVSSTTITGIHSGSGSTGNYYLTTTQSVSSDSLSTFTTNSNITFTGKIDNGSGSAGTILTVTAISGSNIISIGMILSGTGVSSGTTIIALGSGTGGIGTYSVSKSQNTTSTTITGNLTSISGVWYVMIAKTGGSLSDTLALNEIEIYDTNNNKITYTSGNVSVSSTFNDDLVNYGVSYLNDGNTTNNLSTGGFFQTKVGTAYISVDTGAPSASGCYVQIGIGSAMNISCVKIYNRTDNPTTNEPTRPRSSAIGLRLLLKDSVGNIIYTGTEISTVNYSYVLFPYTTTGTLSIGPLIGRYVTFVKTGPGGAGNNINLAEVEVYDNSNTKYTGLTASASSQFGGFPVSNLIDGNLSTFCVTNGNPAIVGGTAGLINTGEWVEVDLGSSKSISKVLLYNRSDSLTNRVLGLTMFILDSSRNIIYTSEQISNINTTNPYYMLSYPDANVSSFSYSTACTFSGIIVDNILSVSSVSSGTLNVGSTITSGPSTSNRYISKLLSGSGGIGTYRLSSSQIISGSISVGNSISLTGSISGNVLTVTAISASGILSLGMILTGGSISSNTQIIQFGTGAGGIGTYILNNSQTISSGSISASFSTTFIGTISNGSNILTVNSVSIGSIYIGMVLTASGVTGLYIIGKYYNTQIYGGAGVYVLSGNASGSITSGSITGQFNSASFTASISDYDINISSVSSGNIYPGVALTNGTNILPNTFIDQQLNGTSTTIGDYTLKTFQQTQSQLFTSGGIVSITGSVSGTTLTVTSLSGLISIGMVLTGTNIVSNTYVTSFSSGTNGGVGTYTVSVNNPTPSTGTITGTLTSTFSGSISSGTNILSAGSPSIGIIYLGMVLSNNAAVNGLYISGYASGTGGSGTYILSGNASATISSVTLNANFNSSSFSGSISGSTLTVTNLGSGAIYVGSILSSGNCLGSTYITSQISGTSGGIGAYSVNVLQSVASQTITATGLASASNTMAYSSDVLNWTSLSPIIFTEGYGISWNGKMWVVGGSGTTSSLIYSYDNLSWFGLGTNIFSRCYNLFWNGCKWIAGGESTNRLAFANDSGTNWKAISSPFTTNCIDIAYNAKKENRIVLPKRLNIMLGTSSNNIQYSYSDPSSFNSAMSWTAVSSPFTTSARSADYNGVLFVAGGEGQNTMAYSFDGLNWVGLGISTFSTICNFVRWNGSMWLAGGQGVSASFIGKIDNGAGGSGNILTVLSNLNGKLIIGMTLSGSTITGGTTITGILSPNTYSVSSSQNISQTFISASSSTGVIAYSYDGLTWLTASTSFFTTSAQWADWNGKIWVCVGTGTNTIGYSTNGINWVSSDTGNILTNSFTVKWNGKIWVAGGSQICYSSDAINWYSVTSPFSAYVYSIDWNENIWVAGGWGLSNSIAYSRDGINWINVTNPALGSRCFGVYWNGAYWLAGGSGTNSYAHSIDGINWSAGSNIFGTQGYSAISTKKSGNLYIQHPLVALGRGANHTLSYSANDGLTFSGLGNNIFPLKSNTTCWNGKLWVAGGVSNSSSFLASITNNTTLTVSEILQDYPTLNPNVSSWGTSSFTTFTQATSANQPTFDGTSVNFVAANSQNLSSTNNLSLNINSNGGFTAIVYLNFTASSPQSYERVFDFAAASGSNNNAIILSRSLTSSDLMFIVCTGTTENPVTTNTGPISTNVWMSIACRYIVGGGSTALQIFKNKSLIISGSLATSAPADRTNSYNNIGRSYVPGQYFQGAIGGLLVYDRALSNSELNIATDALVNKTLNFSTTNLKVRLLALPNPGKIYPGMTLTGTGITSNTKIISGPTSGATGTYTITSSNNVSSNTIVNASSSSLAYSYDALNWFPIGNSIFSNVCNNITWTGSQFVAVGEGLVSFVGSISGTTLSVTSVLSGTIYVGMTIYGSGVTSNTKISALGSGIGSVGNYTVSQSQTVSSQLMNGTPITVAFSTDGINWTPTQNQIASAPNSNIYDGQKTVVASSGFTSFIGRIDNGSGSSSGNTLTVSEILYDYPIANPSVNRWNIFSQYTTANQPTFDGTSVNFARANSQYLSNNNLTFNINTNGGFTALIYIRFTGSSISSERLLDFSSVFGISTSGNSIQFYRSGQNVFIQIAKSNFSYASITSSGNEIIQNEWAVFSCRYTKIGTTTSPIQIYKNKNLIASGFSTADPIDFTTTYNFIGRDTYFSTIYTNCSIGGLLVYDRSLSDTELNNATDALVNKTLNFSTDNLKVRLLIMNPNTSLIYPGMRLSGAGIADGTIISSYGSGSGGVGTYTISGSAQTITPALINASNVNISSSSDLVTWTSSGSTNLPALAINGITFNGNRYVTVGGGVVSFLAKIDNGSGASGNILTVSVVYSGSIYIGMTIYASGVTNSIVTSYGTGSGGIGTYNLTVSQNITSRMMFGSPLTMSYSSDLSTWSPVTNSAFTNQGNCISWNGQSMISVGDGSDYILYSSDGISWSPVSNSTTLLSANPTSINWTGKRWIASGSVLTSSFTGSISGTTLTVSAITNSPIIYVGMLISGTGVAPGTKIVSGTASPYTVNISQSVSSTTMTGSSNASVYSFDGLNWSDMGSNTLISGQCTGVFGNPRVGTVVVDSQTVIDSYGNGLTDSLELVSDKFYNNDYNVFSGTFLSNLV